MRCLQFFFSLFCSLKCCVMFEFWLRFARFFVHSFGSLMPLFVIVAYRDIAALLIYDLTSLIRVYLLICLNLNERAKNGSDNFAWLLACLLFFFAYSMNGHETKFSRSFLTLRCFFRLNNFRRLVSLSLLQYVRYIFCI